MLHLHFCLFPSKWIPNCMHYFRKHKVTKVFAWSIFRFTFRVIGWNKKKMSNKKDRLNHCRVQRSTIKNWITSSNHPMILVLIFVKHHIVKNETNKLFIAWKLASNCRHRTETIVLSMKMVCKVMYDVSFM